MLEMNEFEKIAQEIVEKKEKETDEFFEIVYFLLTIISVFICLFFYGFDDLMKRTQLTIIVVICVFIVGVPLYFLLKPMMLRNDREYELAIEILESYEEKLKNAKTKEIENQEKENIENIKKLEEYAKKLKEINKI